MKTILRYIFIVVIFLQLPQDIRAQFFSLGNDPARAKWNEIKTENYSIIYPEEIDSLARKYAYTLEKHRPKVLEPLSINPKPIPIILHPYTTISNGMVVWAPKRVELITTPSAYGGDNIPWEKLLVIHETRHIGQIEHFTKGIYSKLYPFLGEQITGAGIGLYPSITFLEGDAVIAETELTKAGRGREAEFMKYYRAAFLNNDFRNYDKYRFGSYRYYTPDHYALGYIINTAIRFNSSNYFWSRDYLKHLVANFYDIKAQSNAMEAYAGMSKNEYFKFSQELISHIWKRDFENRGNFSPSKLITPKTSKYYTDYKYPIQTTIGDKSYVIGIKNGMEDPTSLIIVDEVSGEEKVLRPFSSISSPLIISPNGRIYWTETIFNTANSIEDFSVLKSYHPLEKKIKDYKKDTRFFNPTLSSNGEQLAVVEYPIAGSSFLVFLNPINGREISRIEAPNKGQIKEITFVGDKIYATAILESGLGIYLLKGIEWEEIIPQQFQSIKGLRSYGEKLYFSSDLDGVLNIYYIDLITKKLYRITNTKYGGSFPFIQEKTNTLYYSEYSHLGYKFSKVNIDSLVHTPMDFSKPYKHPIAEMLSYQSEEDSKINIEEVDSLFDPNIYIPTKYNKLKNLFRFHSWAPLYYNVDKIMNMSYQNLYEIASLGFTAYSQSTLGTAETMVGYSYHNGFHSGHLKFNYSGFSPKIEFSLDYNDRKNIYIKNFYSPGNSNEISTPKSKPYLESNIRIYYPLNLFGDGWNSGFIPQINWRFTNDYFYSAEKNKNLPISFLSYGANYYKMRPIHKSGIFPRWGYGSSIMGTFFIGTGKNLSNNIAFNTYGYLPGITKQQGLKLSLTYQHQFKEKPIYFSNYTSLPRGYTNITPGKNIIKTTIDYAVPIYLNDLSLSNILYLKRIQAIPFFDYAYNSSPSIANYSYYSYGSDILIDLIFLRIDFPISIGVRGARTREGENSLNFLLNINLLN